MTAPAAKEAKAMPPTVHPLRVQWLSVMASSSLPQRNYWVTSNRLSGWDVASRKSDSAKANAPAEIRRLWQFWQSV